MNLSESFRKASHAIAHWVGTSVAFILAVLTIIVWAITGPIFQFSDTWQLVINTGTTIITFLMVFLIQNAQNRDSVAIHLKLDELIRASKARNTFINLENVDDATLKRIQKEIKESIKDGNEERNSRVPD